MRISLKGWLVVSLLLGTTLSSVSADDITVTTYYPSPRGVYQELRVGAGEPQAPTGMLYVIKSADDGNVAFRVDDAANDLSPFAIDQDGNVGIGTAAPSGKLYITDDALSGTRLKLENTRPGGRTWVLQSTGPAFIPGPGGAGNFAINVEGRGPRLVITPTDMVGIGTTEPVYPLDVVRDVDIPPQAPFDLQGVGVVVRDVEHTLGAGLGIGNAAQQAGWSIAATDAGGAVRRATLLVTKNSSRASLGLLGVDEVLFVDDDTGTLLASIGQTTSWFSGNVGIGTEGPQAKLDVAGPLKIGDVGSFDPVDGMIRYDPGTQAWEGYADGEWWELGRATKIHILSAIYAANCGAPTPLHGLGPACEGKRACTYEWYYGVDPGFDPAYGCPKDLKVEYSCSGVEGTKQIYLGAGAVSATLVLVCP